MKCRQVIRQYDRRDKMTYEWLLHEFEVVPEFWVDVCKVDRTVAQVLLGRHLLPGFTYFIEFERIDNG